MMKVCKRCYLEYPESDEKCRHCGERLEQLSSQDWVLVFREESIPFLFKTARACLENAGLEVKEAENSIIYGALLVKGDAYYKAMEILRSEGFI